MDANFYKKFTEGRCKKNIKNLVKPANQFKSGIKLGYLKLGLKTGVRSGKG